MKDVKYNEDEFYELNIDFNDPLQILMETECPDITQNEYREASKHFIRIMELGITYILESRNPIIATWAVAYVLNLPVCDTSIREKSRQLGISSGTISASMANFRKITGLPRPLPYISQQNL